MLYKQHTWDKGEPWETKWHVLYLDDAESDKVFLSINEICECWRIDGQVWKRCSSGSRGDVVRRPISEWLRERLGPPEGEVWEYHRVWHPDEERPIIPRGGRGALIQAGFKCWPDIYRTYEYAQWAHHNYINMDMKGVRSLIRFKDETTAVLFRMLFL